MTDTPENDANPQAVLGDVIDRLLGNVQVREQVKKRLLDLEGVEKYLGPMMGIPDHKIQIAEYLQKEGDDEHLSHTQYLGAVKVHFKVESEYHFIRNGIIIALDKHKKNLQKTADGMNISRTTLSTRIKDYKIDRESDQMELSTEEQLQKSVAYRSNISYQQGIQLVCADKRQRSNIISAFASILEQHSNDKTATAKSIGIHRTTFNSALLAYEIS
jgi:transcriptional regulator with PAS, ATPase and Fis domain